MADGYLESKREQYEARKAQWLKQKKRYSYQQSARSQTSGKAAQSQTDDKSAQPQTDDKSAQSQTDDKSVTSQTDVKSDTSQAGKAAPTTTGERPSIGISSDNKSKSNDNE